jgi:hypothetical protein
LVVFHPHCSNKPVIETISNNSGSLRTQILALAAT